jgi:hypothetical protein
VSPRCILAPPGITYHPAELEAAARRPAGHVPANHAKSQPPPQRSTSVSNLVLHAMISCDLMCLMWTCLNRVSAHMHPSFFSMGLLQRGQFLEILEIKARFFTSSSFENTTPPLSCQSFIIWHVAGACGTGESQSLQNACRHKRHLPPTVGTRERCQWDEPIS